MHFPLSRCLFSASRAGLEMHNMLVLGARLVPQTPREMVGMVYNVECIGGCRHPTPVCLFVCTSMCVGIHSLHV